MIKSNIKNTFVLLSLGANMGDKKSTLDNAVETLVELGAISQVVVSSYYGTEPYGVKDQNWFINICVKGMTQLSPIELLAKCKQIEQMYGRQQRERWHEREIDIDIIFYGKEIVETKNLTIPHKEYKKRNFVLVPAAEIAGSYIPPNSNHSLRELIDKCTDCCKIDRIE
ncbi:MAG: 2-amino-4-hydroxy-6-hydroxymethyldihydropteridine diphosphokinase [Candidatus Kapaibacterium sp.]|nr:2-amino-4-hydroxy-6-hydroxymethyldihydropteridine diphosphokinase [Ignavibacteriota bacterium]MCB9220478.1 2-amino-4-hydroxy-6-hydroxymethyldihydropteridine diphosphokinase [Ignavibacteria bacterium]